ncbi:hypothetical protein [Mycolicibacterium frederiksbergense]|uniref:hypothetical protein n=1 Tax=Mycolicibacterium frederiksbergense TaxID=117567 RepID=UPI00265C839C|nr:hypothetical protein [Mycolicibacterium frederiksbergense]MDO0975162.1 hypothetical protein [Mycolicibacterium frederiksbergense]
MSDGNEIIDVEVEEIHETPNLPAVVTREATHSAEASIEAPRPQTPDGRDWPHGPKPERRCTAHSSRTGLPCKNAAIKGGTVCRYHGGAAKQIKQAARTRLENAADLMAKQLLGIALTAESEQVKLNAIRDALDRAGLRAPSEVVLSQGEAKPFETVFESIGGDPAVAGFPSAPIGEGISAGVPTSPAPAYPGYRDDEQAEAGSDVPGDADEYGAQPAPTGSPRQPRRRECDRERQPQPGARHITGETAMQVANWANRAMAESHGLPWGESDRRRR